MVWAPAPSTDEKLDAFLSKFEHFETLIAHIPAITTWMSRMDSHITKNTWILRLGLQRSNRTSAPSLHVCAKSRQMLPQHQIYQVRQDPGLQSNKLTAPQPLGPMAQDHPVTTGTRDVALILLQTLMMKMREMPSCYGSHANNTTKGLRSGSIIIFVKNPTCQPTVDLLRFIVKQVP